MSPPSIPPPGNCLPLQIRLFRCLREMDRVTSLFTAMDAGCIRFRKKRLPWHSFILIRRPERLGFSKPSLPYHPPLRGQPSLPRSCSRPTGIFYTPPIDSTIQSRSSPSTAKADCITWEKPQPWAITQGTYKSIPADPLCMRAINAAIASRPFESIGRRDC